MDFFLRADSEDELKAALPSFCGPDGWIADDHTHSLLAIGAIDGDSRFHINIRLLPDGEMLASEIEASGFVINPQNPSIAWL